MDTLLIIVFVFAVLTRVTALFLKKKKIQSVLPSSEYFFERPELLQSKHPVLFDLLSTIFRQHPQKPESI